MQEMQETWIQSLSGTGLGRSPGGGNGKPLQYSCLENSMDRGAWQATVPRITKSQDWAHAHTHSEDSANLWQWFGKSGLGLTSLVLFSKSHNSSLLSDSPQRTVVKLSELICVKVHTWNVNTCSEQCHKITPPAIDIKLWFQISTYFHQKVEPHTCDKVWMRWCVIRRALGKLLSVMTGSGCWHTGDENLVNCVNLSKFAVPRMWKVTMAAFFTFGDFFWKKKVYAVEGF